MICHSEADQKLKYRLFENSKEAHEKKKIILFEMIEIFFKHILQEQQRAHLAPI